MASWTLRCDENLITIFYRPLEDNERRGVIESIATSPLAEIVFPFSFLLAGKERRSLPTGWTLEPERAENLSVGEENLRDFSISLVRSHGDSGLIIFDPACSTGEFLSKIKLAVPSATVVGQDISKQMVDHAKSVIEEVYQDDALNPALQDGSADFVFCRFLNSEVLDTKSARIRLKRLARVVGPNGALVIFGHTPVLVVAAEIQELGFDLESCSGTDGAGSVFSILSWSEKKRLE